MSKRAYLAIDLGAESGRTIVGTLQDDRLTLHETHRFTHLGRQLPSGLHWDLTGLWGDVLAGVRESVAWSRVQQLDLTSLGVDTWGVDWGCLGAGGELLGLPHCYRDEQNGPAYEKVLTQLGPKAVYDATGIQLMSINSLFQVVARYDTTPALLDNAEKLLFMPDLFHFFFTGNAQVEATIASTSQMLDPHTGQWATALLGQLGLPTHMLGEIVPPGTTIGTILPSVADEVGADKQLKVIAPASHDTAAAVAAVPADPKTSWCYLSSGTWSLIGAELDAPV